MGEVRPQSETMRAGLIPHRWTRIDDPRFDRGRRRLRDDHRRRRPRRPDGRLRAEQARQVVRRPRGRPPPGRRDQPDRPVQGLSLRHRRPPLLLQERRGQRALGRDPGRRVPDPRPAQPHLLRPQVLPLSAQAGRRPLEAGLPQVLPHRGQLPEGPDGSRSGPSGRSRTGSSTGSVASCSRPSSSRTRRRSGGCRPTRSPPTGPRSGSRT